jgi:hypothetical protein
MVSKLLITDRLRPGQPLIGAGMAGEWLEYSGEVTIIDHRDTKIKSNPEESSRPGAIFRARFKALVS